MISLIRIVVVILFPLVIVLNVFNYYAFSGSFYKNELPKHNVENIQDALKVVSYLKDKGQLPAVSEKEKVHMSDVKSIIQALNKSKSSSMPAAIIAKTMKGKGVSFLENKDGWHGKALNEEDYRKAINELGKINLEKTWTIKSASK